MSNRVETHYQTVTVPDLKTTVLSENKVGLPFAKLPWAKYRVHKISEHHGRSVQESIGDKKVYWEDEFGNPMGTRSIKGLPLEDPYLVFAPEREHKLAVFGLMNGGNVIGKASDYMRSNHLPTERTVELRELEEIPCDGQKIPVEKWKKIILEQTDTIVNPKNPRQVISHEKIEKYLNSAHFYVMERDSQVGERLADLSSYNSSLGIFCVVDNDGKIGMPLTKRTFSNPSEFRASLPQLLNQWERKYRKNLVKNNQIVNEEEMEGIMKDVSEQMTMLVDFIENQPDHRGIVTSGYYFKKTLEGVFNWINARNIVEAKRKETDQFKSIPENFDINNPEDITRFVVEYFPQEAGRYLAKFHTLGLSHGYTTKFNWTLAATLVDLDSVKGKPLGNTEITDDNLIKDLYLSSYAIFEVFYNKIKNVRFDRTSYPFVNYLYQIHQDSLVEKIKEALINFFSSYIRQTLSERDNSGDENIPVGERLEEIILSSLDNLGFDDEKIDDLYGKIAERAGLE